MAEVSVASSEFGGEQSIGLCVVGFLPPTGLYNTVLLGPYLCRSTVGYLRSCTRPASTRRLLGSRRSR